MTANPSVCISMTTYGSKTRNQETELNPFLHNHPKTQVQKIAKRKLTNTIKMGTENN
jgi:hypothetical protein